MAATSSPIIPNDGANISAPTPLAIELSATHASATFRILIGQLPG